MAYLPDTTLNLTLEAKIKKFFQIAKGREKSGVVY
jgi:hypothetical protein